MFFNHKTKEYIGKMGEVTYEELCEEQRLIKQGVCVCFGSPSQESLDIMNDIYASRDVDAEVAKARSSRLRREHEK